MGEIKLSGYICERCSHKWISRNSHKPICCAKCKSPYWNVPRRKKSPFHSPLRRASQLHSTKASENKREVAR
ncbi:hypothetical protein HYV49_03065 [Candidatus Pacearchaeota archaeon]|nr:hypothetical protein [Candidatus Pacearchaeota archaeon]